MGGGGKKGKGKKGGGKKGKGNKGQDASAPMVVDPALTKLHNFAKQNDLPAMEEHGLTTINLQYTDQLTRVPLHLAAFGGHLQIVDRILSLCPESAALPAQDGFLPVHFATQQGHAECVRSLVRAAGKSSINPDPKPGSVKRLMGKTVKGERNLLHLACAKAHMEVVFFLLEKGCDLQAKNTAGKTPLELLEAEQQAAVREHVETLAAKKAGGSKVEGAGGGVQQAGEEQPAQKEPAGEDGAAAEPEELNADDMEAKLLALAAGGKKKKKKRDKEERDASPPGGKRSRSSSPKHGGSSANDAGGSPSAKKAKVVEDPFSLDAVLRDSYA